MHTVPEYLSSTLNSGPQHVALTPSLPADISATSSQPFMMPKAEFEINWTENDPQNPRNWFLPYKFYVIFAMGYGATVVSLFSTSYSVSIPGLQDDFHISKITGLLGITTYLLGMAVGSVFLAPLSETLGRRPVYLLSAGLFTIFVLPCALAKNIETILISRFFACFFGSALVSNSPGSVNDIVREHHRALALGLWSIGPINGPVLGPIIGGFVFEYLGWRWTNWLIMMMGGLALVLVGSVEETYAPVLLRGRAARKRQETGNLKWWSSHDTHLPFLSFLRTNISRPFIMLLTEPICIFWDWYVAIVYGILYLCFVAYPIAFQTNRGWSPGIGGLAYLGIGCGTLTIITLEPLLRKWINTHPKVPSTSKVPPEAMVRVTCVGAIALAVGEIWFAWTSTPNVHWVVPILAGIPFGAGNAAVFIYSNNYLAHSYGVYSASALAGNTVLRSVMGAVLPLAGPVMYERLGLEWASFMLGMAEAVCVVIPFVFLFYGHQIRERSTMIRKMQEGKGS